MSLYSMGTVYKYEDEIQQIKERIQRSEDFGDLLSKQQNAIPFEATHAFSGFEDIKIYWKWYTLVEFLGKNRNEIEPPKLIEYITRITTYLDTSILDTRTEDRTELRSYMKMKLTDGLLKSLLYIFITFIDISPELKTFVNRIQKVLMDDKEDDLSQLRDAPDSVTEMYFTLNRDIKYVQYKYIYQSIERILVKISGDIKEKQKRHEIFNRYKAIYTALINNHVDKINALSIEITGS